MIVALPWQEGPQRVEDAVSLQTTNVHTARATLEESLAEVEKAKIAIPAYLEGEYQSTRGDLFGMRRDV